METEKLGVIEFTSTLNGDDSDQVLAILKKFVKTVRREKSEAFISDYGSDANDSDSDYLSDSDDDDKNFSSRKTKKSKVETWKEDSKKYNVPFVGTSTRKGATGVVTRNQWPTGFLEAYLQSSPSAIEILGPDFQRLLSKGTKTLQFIFLEAMSELVSSNIDSEKISLMENIFDIDAESYYKADAISDSKYTKLVSIVMKDHLKTVFDILNEHAFNSTGHRLILASLNLFQNLSCSSLGTAREITRGLESKLKEGIIQRLCNYSVMKKKKSSPSEQEKERLKKISSRIQAAAISLAKSLLEYDDPLINGYISSIGGKQNKSKAGILFISIRNATNKFRKLAEGNIVKIGDVKNDENSESIITTAQAEYEVRTLHCIRTLKEIYLADDKENKKAALSDKAKFEYFKGAMLDNLVHLAYMPGETKFHEESYVPEIIEECRAIVETLIMDKDRSPFLKLIRTSQVDQSLRVNVLQQSGKAIQSLLCMRSNIEARILVSKCFQNTPQLYQQWTRNFSMPDIAANYACISSLSLISYLIENAPDINIVDEILAASTDMGKLFESMISFTSPRSFTKNAITKGLQSGNALLVMQTLKVCGLILDRFSKLSAIVCENKRDRSRYFSKKLAGRMPDVQVLLAIRSKFDSNEESRSCKSHLNFIMKGICDTLDLYVDIFPQSFITLQFEWIKLLFDGSSTDFLKAPFNLQRRLLKTLFNIFECYKHVAPHLNSLSSNKSFHVLTDILLQTPNEIVYDHCHNLLQEVIADLVDTKAYYNEKNEQFVDYEISLWVNGISPSNRQEIAKLVDATQKITIQFETIVQNAWRMFCENQSIPKGTITPLLVFALTAIASNGDQLSAEMQDLILSITNKMVVIQSENRLITAVILYLSKIQSEDHLFTEEFKDLVRTSTRILNTKSILFMESIITYFPPNHYHSVLESQVLGKESSWHVKDAIVEHNAFEIFSQSMRHINQTSCLIYPTVFSTALLLMNGQLPNTIMNRVVNLDTNLSTCTIGLLLSSFFENNKDNENQRRLHLAFTENLIQDDKETTEKFDQHHSDLTYMLSAAFLGQSSKETCRVFRGCLNLISIMMDDIDSRSQYYSLLLKIMDSVPHYLSILSELTTNDAVVIFELWYNLASSLAQEAESKSLMCKLEDALAYIMRNSNVHKCQPAAIVKSLNGKGLSSVIDLSFKSESQCTNKDVMMGDRKTSFLESLIIFDAFKFAPLIAHAMKSNSNFESDDLITVAAREVILQNSSEQGSEWHIEGCKLANQVLCQKIQDIVQTGIVAESTSLLLDTVRTIFGSEVVSYNASTGLLFQRLSEIMTHLKSVRRKDISLSLERSLLSLIESIPKEFRLNDEFLSLRLSTLSYIVKMLPRAIKQESQSALILSAATDLIEAKYLQKITCLQHLFLTCLKFGLDLIKNKISVVCLRVARKIFTLCNEEQLSKKDKTNSNFQFSPSKVHEMIFAHSNFEVVARETSDVRQELISLLICCVKYSEEAIDVSIEDVSKLLKGFHASVSREDLFLRRLLLLYEESSSKEFYPHELRWGKNEYNTTTSIPIISSDHGLHWEYFIENIDAKRIYKTIEQFPVWDTLMPEVYDFEVSEDSSKIQEEDKDSDGESYSTDSVENKKTLDDKQYKKDLLLKYSNSADIRYSPGFILPLFLGLLESFAEMAITEDVSDVRSLASESDNEAIVDKKRKYKEQGEVTLSDSYRESFAKVVQRISSKGLLALSLATLSSKCPKLRNVAIGVIFHFLKVLKMKEAIDLKYWTSRNQLEMLLNAVQRGLTVSRARRLEQNQDSEDKKLLIPMLPNFSGCFLARASMILMKPSDDMYAAMNKYFLRLSDYHGAFTDCFSLPAFISLFCTVNESTEQGRKERLWAINLLKEGVVDSFSYKMASRKHVPELLLSSSDAIFMRRGMVEDHHECSLLFDTIGSLVRNGGPPSFYHYFYSIGIVAWLENTMELMIANFEKVPPTLALRLLCLLKVILFKIEENLSYSDTNVDIFVNTKSLARNGLNLSCLLLFSNKKESNDTSEFVETCAILEPLYSILSSVISLQGGTKEESSENTLSHFHPDGLKISVILKAIDLFKHQELNQAFDVLKVVASFSVVPFDLDCKDDELKQFCLESMPLMASSNHKEIDEVSYTHIILRRISEASVYMKEEKTFFLVIEHLFGLRHTFIEQNALDKWNDCISLFLENFNASFAATSHNFVELFKVLSEN